ncbi:hypothetical protein FACS1894193_13400 [Bacilli bacterium]|nr:hypothetical protein FACS1894193_13400 [Bacilli bacterium]
MDDKQIAQQFDAYRFQLLHDFIMRSIDDYSQMTDNRFSDGAISAFRLVGIEIERLQALDIADEEA